jgi:hypothetical protein
VPIIECDLEPVVNVIEAVAISMSVDEWTDAVEAREARNIDSG